ncbi:MAG TPA: carboxypeptidase-like regulatory domain-containing protein [Methylomirabilota bacterium]|jgi:hypothetical protein
MPGPRSRLTLALIALLVAAWSTPGETSEKWGPFRGQLVDQATGKGIAGAAVIAIWWKNEPNPVQMNRSFFDATEAVTDAEGRFEIPRYAKPPFFDFQIFLPEITYFAPGYLSLRKQVTPSDGQPFVAETTIFMERIETREALAQKSRSGPAAVPLDKMKEFTKAVNVERALLGLSPITIPAQETKP